MKGIIIASVLLFIFVIYISSAGIMELKEAYTKTIKKGGGDATKPEYKIPEYYKLNEVWENPEDVNFEFKGISVPNTNNCGLYTYETYLSVDKINEDGSLNTLVDEKFSRPNLDDVFDDLVNGFCHSTEIKPEQESQKCIDVDQIYAKRVKRTCKDTDDRNNINRCISSKGLETPPSGTEFYNICDGEIGCISLNYFSDSSAIYEETKCMSIKEIEVPANVAKDLSFYTRLGIIKINPDIEEDGPYPATFDFKICNTIDPKQKFKIIRYEFKEEEHPILGRVRLAKFNKLGSYASIIFRGFNSYLDMGDEGKFVLRKITSGVTTINTIKWIFMPPVKITNKTIPSLQRCLFIRSNVEIFGLNAGSGLPEGTTGSLAGRTALDAAAKLYLSIESIAGIDAGKAVASKLALNFSKYLGVSSVLGKFLTILAILQIISALINQVSYLEPPIIPAGVPLGTRVSPTNYMGAITDVGPRLPGQATPVMIENFCLPREVLDYPPYFLESLTDNQLIEPALINYRVDRDTSVALSSVVAAQVVWGIFLYNRAANLDINPTSSTANIWRDKNTVWKVYGNNERFIDSVGYPSEYFSGSSGGVEKINITNMGVQPPPSENYYIISPNGISKLSYTPDETEDFERQVLEKEQKEEGREINGQLAENVETNSSKDGSGCKLNILIGTRPTGGGSEVRILSGFNISDPGKNYPSVGVTGAASDTFTIDAVKRDDLNIGPAAKFTLRFKVEEVTRTPYIFKALVKKKGLDRWFLPSSDDRDNSDIDQDYGFGFVIESNYNPTLPEGEKFNYNIINRGFNYNTEDTYYLVQYSDSFPNKTYPTNLDLANAGSNIDILNLISFRVTKLSEPGYEFTKMAPESLINDLDFNMVYNFMDGSDNKYESSPQQIVYGGELDNNQTDLIDILSSSIPGRLNSKKLYDFFLNFDNSPAGAPPVRLSNKGIVQPGDISIMNLKSLQVNTLKYKQTYNVQEKISEGSSVVLGRFIPYQSFETSKKREEDTGELAYGVSTAYYNWNNAQIIPYGIKNVYTNVNFIRNPPAF